jgi:O-succinylbenzoic acid--CoA ligase
LAYPQRIVIEFNERVVRAVSGELMRVDSFGDSSRIINAYFDHLNGKGPGLNLCETKATDSQISLLVPTSGSTGIAKFVALSKESLLTNATLSSRYLEAHNGSKWSLLLPLTHIAAFNVLTRSFVSQTTPSLSLQEDVDFTAIVPTQLHAALYGERDKDKDLLAHLKNCTAVLVGGAAAHTTLLDMARSHGITVVTTYGMSEMTGGCVYNNRPLPGVEIVIKDPINEVGIIELSGPTLALGYYNTATQKIDSFENNRFTTNDLGSYQNNLLHVYGRNDDVINSGGEKISLSAVENFLKSQFPAEEFCAVGIADEQWGEKLALAFTNNSGVLSPEIMIDSITQEFAKYFVPKVFHEVPQMPLKGIGKIDRTRVKEIINTL